MQSPGTVRFGVFEVDLQARELRKSGLKLKIQEQPFQVLAALLERPGEVVTREELRQSVWPQDTFVDFDHSLNTAVNKLREALGDSASSPRFIETLPRRGYRFLAGVERLGDAAAKIESRQPLPEQEGSTPAAGRHRQLAWLLAVVAAILAAAVWFRFFQPVAKPPAAEWKVTPLTSYPGDERSPSFSPDGSQIAFAWNGKKQNNFNIYVKVLEALEPLQLTTGTGNDYASAWSPDGRRIAFYRQTHDRAAIYWVPPVGGPERKLTDLRFTSSLSTPSTWLRSMSWSPDSKLLVFEDKESPAGPFRLFLFSIAAGETWRLPIASKGFLDHVCPAFSPDGRTLAFIGVRGARSSDIYAVPVAGGGPTQLTFDGRATVGLAWTPDGREIVFSSEREGQSSLWRIPASGGTPKRLAEVGENAMFPCLSRQGRRLAFQRQVEDSNIWRLDTRHQGGTRSSTVKLIESTRRDENPQFSPDGKRIAFVSDRSGNWELWVCASDGSNPVQLTSLGGPENGFPSWSPDGRSIAFDSNLKGNFDVFVIRTDGGSPRPLTTDTSADARPSWSRDGRWIYFGSDRSGSWQVWKVPVQGGSAVQVTKKGGQTPAVSPDGKFVYYSKGPDLPGVWRVPAEGGEEEPVLPDYMYGFKASWAPMEGGIYFADWEGSRGFLKFLNFSPRRVTEIVPLEKRWVTSLLSVSPDGRWLLFSQIDQAGQDLVLIENFR